MQNDYARVAYGLGSRLAEVYDKLKRANRSPSLPNPQDEFSD